MQPKKAKPTGDAALKELKKEDFKLLSPNELGASLKKSVLPPKPKK